MYRPFAHITSECSRWFELHNWDYLKTWDAGADIPDHFRHLAALGVPVYTTEKLPAIIDQHQIDWVRVFADLCSVNKGFSTDALTAQNYFLGSPSLMLLFALWEHDQGNTVEYIQSYGIDTSDTRHKQQRQSWAFWCGQAMARGIQLGGTMTDFMLEPEMDDGLRGLRELIGDGIEKKIQAPGSTDYVIAAHYTDNEPFTGYRDRLNAQCEALGIKCFTRKLPAAEYGEGVSLNRSEVFNTVFDAMEETGKPVIYMDIDDEIVKAPTLPAGFNTVGVWQNPELQAINSVLPVSSFFAAAPTDHAKSLLEMVRPTAETISPHRAINALWASCQGWRQAGVIDITNHVKGCFKINPSRNRKKVCYT